MGNQRLVSHPEAPTGSPVHSLIVSTGGERAVPLPPDCVSLARAQLVARWGYKDGSVRFFRQRAVASFPNATPMLLCARLHGGEPIIAATVSADGTWLITGDALGELAVWRLRHRSSPPLSLRAHVRLCAHQAPIRRVCCSGAHRSLASLDAAGLMMLWDLRKGVLLHVLRVCPRSSLIAEGGVNGDADETSALPVEALAGACAIDETGETLVATQAQIQLWSVNGSLLAASSAPFGSGATSVALLRAPEWMVEQLPIAATGHADGTVRWWSVREPLDGCTLDAALRPRAISRLPVRSHCLPAWELYEMRSLRLERPNDGTASTTPTAASLAARGAVTAICIGEGYEKLLWTASADGRVRAWRAPLTATEPSTDDAHSRLPLHAPAPDAFALRAVSTVLT